MRNESLYNEKMKPYKDALDKAERASNRVSNDEAEAGERYHDLYELKKFREAHEKYKYLLED